MNDLILVRGGGDLATGVISKLVRCGFRVLVLEAAQPTCIRRSVSLGTAVYQGTVMVEGITAELVQDLAAIRQAWASGKVPVLVDETCQILNEIKPLALIDAILAKRNLGTQRAMAPITIALGPGFQAGLDVDVVIETKPGHQLGRLLWTGTAAKDTGNPRTIEGYARERVIYSANAGVFRPCSQIGDQVQAGEVLATIADSPVHAPISGVLRGLLQEGIEVPVGLKLADIDPRSEAAEYCFTCSDKANALGGAVLEALLISLRKLGFQWNLTPLHTEI